VPFWADDVSIGNRLINARCETVHTLRAFREAYSRRRCLVPADGFFEWQKQGKLRQPFLIRRKDHAPFALAGLWERWRQPSADDAVVRSCAIITCPANDLVAPLHDRLPVILAPDAHAEWLDPKTGARYLLKPCPSAWLEAFPVDRRVNNPQNHDPDCIQPAVVPKQLGTIRFLLSRWSAFEAGKNGRSAGTISA
jgi:putative SOS response-associated peptidase YedK